MTSTSENLNDVAAPPANVSGGVSAVDRALAIVAATAEKPEPSTLAGLATATGLYKSTILRLIASLEHAGYVRRLRDGRYVLGPTAFRLGAAYERANPLLLHVLPALHDLVAAGSESASFHVRCGQDARICLLRVNSAHATLDRVQAGDLLPLDRGAAGRILLEFSEMNGAGADRLLPECFAVSAGEREAGCFGMAAPVFHADGTVAGAMSLSGPSSRLSDEVIARWQPKLIEAAAEVTRQLGGCFPKLRQ